MVCLCTRPISLNSVISDFYIVPEENTFWLVVQADLVQTHVERKTMVDEDSSLFQVAGHFQSLLWTIWKSLVIYTDFEAGDYCQTPNLHIKTLV